MSSSGIFPSDAWTIAEGTSSAGPMIARYRSGNPANTDRKSFTNLIKIRWAYEAGDTSGLPGPADLASMGEFEDRILDASDDARWWGSCVAIITHDGVREWRFYTPDIASFQTQFSEALAGLGPYPLDLQAFEDSEWIGLAEIRDGAN